jgi:hypothetical protein
MPARLTIFLSDRPAKVHSLGEGAEILVGRGEECVVRIDDDRASRRHALVRCLDGEWSLVDLGSKNGTQVDGRRLRAAVVLGETSWISFGGLLARFDRLSPQAAARDAEDQLRRWQSSLELQRRLTPSRGLATLLDRLLESVLQLSATERAFVLLADEGGELVLAARRGLGAGDPFAGGFGGSAGAVERALAERRPVATSDALVDPFLAARTSVAEAHIRALVCVPLLALERVIGALYADSTREGKTFSELDVEILEGLAGHAALAITVARLDAELAGMTAGLRATAGAAASPRWRDLLASQRVSGGPPQGRL